MKKRIFIFILSSILIIACSVLVVNANENEKVILGKEKINNITNNNYGNVVEVTVDKNDMSFIRDIRGFKDNCYEYYLSENSERVISIVAFEKPNTPMFSEIKSSKKAKEHALALAKDAFPKLFETDYDVFANYLEDNGCYTVEIWAKTDNKVYTGNKIAIMLYDDGNLRLLASRETEVTSSYSIDKLMNENEAIKIAYNFAIDKVREIYDAEMDDKSNLVISTYMENDNNQMFWFVEISDIIVDDWGPRSITIKVNAEDGNAELYDYTR